MTRSPKTWTFVSALAMAVAVVAGFSASSVQASSTDADTCASGSQLALLALRAEQAQFREVYAVTSPEIGRDENLSAMADALVDDCLENGIPVHENGYLVWIPEPSEEMCWEWALEHLYGSTEDGDGAGTTEHNCVELGNQRYYDCLAAYEGSDKHPHDIDQICQHAATACELDCDPGSPVC